MWLVHLVMWLVHVVMWLVHVVMWLAHVVMWLNLSDWICQLTSIWGVSWPIRLLRLRQLRRSKGIRLYLQALPTQTSQGKKQAFDYGLLVHSQMPLATRHFIQQRAGCNVWYLFSCTGGGEDQQCGCYCLQWTQRTCYWYDPSCTVYTYQLLIIWEQDLKWGYMYVHIPSLIPRLPCNILVWEQGYTDMGMGLFQSWNWSAPVSFMRLSLPQQCWTVFVF